MTAHCRPLRLARAAPQTCYLNSQRLEHYVHPSELTEIGLSMWTLTHGNAPVDERGFSSLLSRVREEQHFVSETTQLGTTHCLNWCVRLASIVQCNTRSSLAGQTRHSTETNDKVHISPPPPSRMRTHSFERILQGPHIKDRFGPATDAFETTHLGKC